jgi:hypothetical protein
MTPTRNNRRLNDTRSVEQRAEHAPYVPKHQDSGQALAEVMSYIAMSVVAIVLIVGALQVLGVDVIDYVRTQIGV